MDPPLGAAVALYLLAGAFHIMIGVLVGVGTHDIALAWNELRAARTWALGGPWSSRSSESSRSGCPGTARAPRYAGD